MACQPNDCVREASFEHAMALNSRSGYFARSKIAPQQPMQDFGHVSLEAAVGRCCRRAGIEEGLPKAAWGSRHAAEALRRSLPPYGQESLAIPPSARIAGRLTNRETGAS
jgi:hypothetical protein